MRRKRSSPSPDPSTHTIVEPSITAFIASPTPSYQFDDDMVGQITETVREVELRFEFLIFDSSDPINVLNFLMAFEMVGNSNGIHESAGL